MRTHLIKILSCLALLPSIATASAADSWPGRDQPVHIIVPAPGGGGTADTVARLLADKLSYKLNGNFIVENRGGANGNIGAAFAANAKPNGYNVLFSWAGTLAVSPNLYKKLPFDPKKDFDPVGLVAEVPNILVINKDLVASSFEEFVSYAKKHPGELNFGSSGNGSSMHIAGEFFMRQTDTKMLHIPYSAPGQATTNLIANDIQVMFQLVPGIIGQIKAEKVRALALLSKERSPSLPDIPTTTELGYPGLLSATWFAMLTPRGTPEPIRRKLNVAVNDILADPDVIAKLSAMGAIPLGGTPETLTTYMDEERKKWGDVLDHAGIKLQ